MPRAEGVRVGANIPFVFSSKSERPELKLSYEESFSRLKELLDIFGDPTPSVTSKPRHDDDPMGPSIFRAMSEDANLENLTMPGLFIGRSELVRASFKASELSLSTLTWNDFTDCDFSNCNLSQSDLRSSIFVRCNFDNANLAESDLRRSTFEGCTFINASFRNTKLYARKKKFGLFKSGDDQTSLLLTKTQKSEVAWSDLGPEPEGG